MNSTPAITTWTIDADADNDATQPPVGMTARAYHQVLAAIYNSRALGCVGATAVVNPDEDGQVRSYRATRDEDAQYAVQLLPAPAPARPALRGHYPPNSESGAVDYFRTALDAAEGIAADLGLSAHTPRRAYAERMVKVARKVVTAKAAIPQYEAAQATAADRGDDDALVEALALGRTIAFHNASAYARSVYTLLGGDDAKLAPNDMEAIATYLVALADARQA